MTTLHLTLKKKWFDMILSGEKKEEYREAKPYWIKRLMYNGTHFFRHFDVVRFTNGYGSDKPSATFMCEGIRIGKGNPDWGGDQENDCFIIKIGILVLTENIPDEHKK